MTPFLKQIAQAYAKHEQGGMIDYCFVFPNKRSGIFFANYLKQLSPSTALQPQLTTISQLVMDLTDGVEASRLELLFALYNVYCELLIERRREDALVDFDRFQYWGEVILNDFNDVDRYMVDPTQLFRNISDLKNIQSNYLTDEQIEVIRQYWGDTVQPSDVDNFWQHISHGKDNPVSERFVRLWQMLLPLYERFGQRLRQLGLTYNGMAYRQAASNLKELSTDDLPYRRYIFVGFNVLSTSEIKIFELLQQRGVADFYWDVVSPAFNNRANRATRFIKEYTLRFPSRYPIDDTPAEHFGDIVVEGIPSNIGQTKRAGEILEELYRIDPPSESSINTAVVLPDEQLLIPMLHSIPANIADVNVTMGFPLRHAPVSALMSNIVLMQSKAQTLHGHRSYYFEHVFSVISHPLLRSIAPATCQGVVDEINAMHIYNLNADYAVGKWPELAAVFAPVTNPQHPDQVFDYADRLSAWLLHHMKEINADEVEQGFVLRYREGVDTLRRLSGMYGITMNEHTFFNLLEKSLQGESISFIGEPLRGLQVMGVLETRALDFDNIIIPSMNERIFPRKHYAPTFIPNNLRRGYGMATIEFQESIFAYYFYRLLTRAKRVYLLYDTRSTGVKSGEMSRYIYQLLYLYPGEKLRMVKRAYKARSIEHRNITMGKSDADMALIKQYFDPESHHYLSPSAIDNYIKCPLHFYLEYIKNYRVDDELRDFMDEGTYGTVLHEVAQHLYESLPPTDGCGAYVTTQVLDGMIKDTQRIGREITRSINANFLKKGADCYDPLVGENLILGTLMAKFITLMLQREKDLAPYTFVGGEKEYPCRLPMAPGLTLNLKGKIDRIDRLPDGTIRLTDYKTGADSTELKSLAQMFDTGNDKHEKCFLQLFLYANAYTRATGFDGPVRPMVYPIRKLSKTKLEPLTYLKQPLLDYREFNDEFINGLTARIKELLDPNIPFYSTPNTQACKYCKFTTICDRE